MIWEYPYFWKYHICWIKKVQTSEILTNFCVKIHQIHVWKISCSSSRTKPSVSHPRFPLSRASLERQLQSNHMTYFFRWKDHRRDPILPAKKDLFFWWYFLFWGDLLFVCCILSETEQKRKISCKWCHLWVSVDIFFGNKEYLPFEGVFPSRKTSWPTKHFERYST